MKRLQTLVLLSAAVAACGGPQPGPDATTDTGTQGDSSRPDSSTTPDAMSRPDSSSMPDATSMPDADMPDADMPDAMTMPDGMSMPDVVCPAGQSACGASCVDPQTDNMNCGACGTVCGMGQTCTAGVCACPMGQTSCGGACVDTQSSDSNCGACGNACPMGQACTAGACRVACAAPRTICGMGATQSCVDTQTDTTNCGSCGNACPAGQSCVAGACACPMGQSSCGGMCVSTQTDNANCGACGNACGAGQTCTAGVCACPMGQTRCGMGATSTCRNLQTDSANCGACGTACAAGRVCAAGVCQASCTGATPNMCGAGTMSFCTNFQTDSANCGACGTACGANATCTAGACRPSNDTAATAVVIPYEVGTRRLVSGSTTGATNDGNVCSGSNNTVFYRIDVLTKSIVYVETFGSTTNTIVGFRTTQTGAAMACNDNACGTMQSQAVFVADVGALYIEVGNAAGGAGAFSFRYTIQPAGGGDVTAITPSTTVQTATGTTAGGTNGVAQSCGSMTSAPEDTFYFTTCPADPARAFHASSCGSSYDTLIEERSVGSAVSCNDDAFFECGRGSSTSPTLPAGAGLHVVYMDGFTTSSVGAYTMQYVYGCNDGFASCGGSCTQYSSFNTDRANCGACGTACGVGLACSNSACGVVPANTFSTVQQPIVNSAAAGGMGGVANTDDCATGQVLIGFTYSADANSIRSFAPICATPALGGSGPSRISTVGSVIGATRGTVTGPVANITCPAGFMVTGVAGRASTVVTQLQLRCAPITVTGMGPYTVAAGTPSIVTRPVGPSTGTAFTSLACPGGRVANGVLTRSGAALDAITLRCESLRVFRAAVNNMGTSALPLIGVANAASMTFSDNCPAGQILAGVSGRTTAGGVNGLAIVCRPYSGLTGVGGWQYNSTADTTQALRGSTPMGATTVNAICAAGAAPSSISLQNNVAGTYVGRFLMGCTRLGSDVAGASTYTGSGNTAIVGVNGGAAVLTNTCATGQIATGLEIRATANIQQIGLRCTPVSSL